jgi:predicted nucleic acid-binding protein
MSVECAMSGEASLPHGAKVLLDTAPVIYLLEDHPEFLPKFLPLFRRAEEGSLRILVTPITVAEVLAGPLKAGREALAERYEQALREGLGWTVVPLDAGLAARAARLRVRYRIRLPDALQLAAALSHGVAALVTHDRDFGQAVDEVPIWGV